ncbi:hypothetical protein [Streptomyces ortus]|uniref:Uncharacterized protein n=1 Tax=Streptomyces ortus TaxID=2867268 RepID=A0ABT3UW86_9ACTN|nr:hypothetical protein [Streptomyces ortus]MCX4231835.1 hypothetical protein [Streptomyces ortus]
MDGQTTSGNDDERKDAEEGRPKRRGLVRQFLIDWSPVLAAVANLVVQHFS